MFWFDRTGVNIDAWGIFKETNLIAFALTKHLTAPISKKYDLDQGWISLLVINKENANIDLIGNELFEKMFPGAMVF